MEVGFCSGRGSGFHYTQPADAVERWALPRDNGSHLLIAWHPDRRACGLNVSSYHVDVQTSTPFLNFFMGIFGTFPQDLCVPGGSKARNAVEVEESSPLPRRRIGPRADGEEATSPKNWTAASSPPPRAGPGGEGRAEPKVKPSDQWKQIPHL